MLRWHHHSTNHLLTQRRWDQTAPATKSTQAPSLALWRYKRRFELRLATVPSAVSQHVCFCAPLWIRILCWRLCGRRKRLASQNKTKKNIVDDLPLISKYGNSPYIRLGNNPREKWRYNMSIYNNMLESRSLYLQYVYLSATCTYNKCGRYLRTYMYVNMVRIYTCIYTTCHRTAHPERFSLRWVQAKCICFFPLLLCSSCKCISLVSGRRGVSG